MFLANNKLILNVCVKCIYCLLGTVSVVSSVAPEYARSTTYSVSINRWQMENYTMYVNSEERGSKR